MTEPTREKSYSIWDIKFAVGGFSIINTQFSSHFRYFKVLAWRERSLLSFSWNSKEVTIGSWLWIKCDG